MAGPTLTVRDQGFRPYLGARLPPSHNTWVLFRHGLSRALKSWFVRMAIVASTLPLLGALAAWAFTGFLATQNPGQIVAPDLVAYVRDLMRAEMWLSAAAVAFGAGASVIADDVARHALPFFFAKPVSANQYLGGRTSAIFALIVAVLLGPVLVFVPLAVALDQHLGPADLSVLFPATASALVTAAALSSISLGVSAISRSRTLTTTLFASLWLVPHVLAALASVFADDGFPYLISLPAQLTFVLEGLLERPREPFGPGALHALPIVTAASALALYAAHRRIEQARGAT